MKDSTVSNKNKLSRSYHESITSPLEADDIVQGSRKEIADGILVIGPNNSDIAPPEYCPPTPECLITRLEFSRNICNSSQGMYEPVVCPAGHFCGSGGKQVAPCPQGYFCPLGTMEPFRCGSTSVCPEGSDREFVMDGFIVTFIIDFIFLALIIKPLFTTRIFRRKDSDSKPAGQSSEDGLDLEFAGFGPGLLAHQMERVELEREDENPGYVDDTMEKFVTSVKSCVGSSDVGFSFGFEELSLVLANGKTIVAPQSGFIPEGSVWAVMGPSGAGKSK